MRVHLYNALFIDRAGAIRPELIPLAAYLCSADYGSVARGIILDHAAAGAPLADLTRPTPDGWIILDPNDLDAAAEALDAGIARNDAAKGGLS